MIQALEPIKSLHLQNAVGTGDAAFTFKPIVEAIRARGGDYFLFVKANQPELRADIARAFGDVSPELVVSPVPARLAERTNPQDLKRAETVEKAQGRIATRRIAVRTAPHRP